MAPQTITPDNHAIVEHRTPPKHYRYSIDAVLAEAEALAHEYSECDEEEEYEYEEYVIEEEEEIVIDDDDDDDGAENDCSGLKATTTLSPQDQEATTTASTTASTSASYPDSESYADYDFGTCNRYGRKNSTCVRFAVTIKRTDTLHLVDYTEEEIKKCWWTRDRRKKTESDIAKIVARMEAGKPPKKDMTYRGLEAWTAEGSYRRTMQVALCIDAVMDEQEVQWDSGLHEVERIAAQSQRVSMRSMGAALNNALQDRKEALDAARQIGSGVTATTVGQDGDDDDDLTGGKILTFLSQDAQLQKHRKKKGRKYPKRRSYLDPPGAVVSTYNNANGGGAISEHIASTSNMLLQQVQNVTKSTAKSLKNHLESNKKKKKSSRSSSSRSSLCSTGSSKSKSSTKSSKSVNTVKTNSSVQSSSNNLLLREHLEANSSSTKKEKSKSRRGSSSSVGSRGRSSVCSTGSKRSKSSKATKSSKSSNVVDVVEDNVSLSSPPPPPPKNKSLSAHFEETKKEKSESKRRSSSSGRNSVCSTGSGKSKNSKSSKASRSSKTSKKSRRSSKKGIDPEEVPASPAKVYYAAAATKQHIFNSDDSPTSVTASLSVVSEGMVDTEDEMSIASRTIDGETVVSLKNYTILSRVPDSPKPRKGRSHVPDSHKPRKGRSTLNILPF